MKANAPKHLIRRWQGWTLPSKLSVVGGIIAIPAIALGIAAWLWPDLWKHNAPIPRPAPSVQQITSGDGSAAIVGDHNTVTTGTKEAK